MVLLPTQLCTPSLLKMCTNIHIVLHCCPITMVLIYRSIGTFARALLDGAKKPQISLRLGAAAASRDITLFHAMDTLNQNDYDITQATSCLVPRGPVLCADELEAWTQGKKRGGHRRESGGVRGRERERERSNHHNSLHRGSQKI